MIFPHDNQLAILVDDDQQLREAGAQSLGLAGIDVRAFPDAQGALRTINREFDGVVVTDLRMPKMDGLEFFDRIKEIDAGIPVIFITGHADVPIAVRALHDGAFDFQTKPFVAEELVAAIRNAQEKRRLVLDNRALRAAIGGGDSPLIGDSPRMVELRETIAQFARADIDVLVEGETGTGKELIAHMLHRQSRRRGRPFVAVNCAAILDHVAELELFGRAFGTLPNDRKEVIGRIEASSSGTLFLDEIDGSSPAVQASLLRVIEEREITRAGSSEPRAVDLRIIASSKRDLARLSEAGEFRKDLYYRLSMVRLRLPPLREHRADIPQLFSYFVETAKEKMGTEHYAMNDAVRRHLLNHSWPGNVRELRNFAFEAVLGISQAADADSGEAPRSLVKRMEQFERSILRDALRLTRGDIPRTMELLELPRKTLYDKLGRYQINPKYFRG